MTDLQDHLAGITRDLDAIDDQLRWATTQAWWPHRRPIGAPRGRNLPPINTDDPDTLPAPRTAIGIGDHKAQQAIHTTRTHLAAAESAIRVTFAAYLARGYAPKVTVVRRPNPSPLLLAAQIRMFAGLLHPIVDQHPTTGNKRKIAQARREVDRALGSITAAFPYRDDGTTEVKLSAKQACIICKIRVRRPNKRRCETCHKWKTRNGYERPRRLDSVHDAKQAQARRRARGEGWGDESLSGARKAV